MDLLLLRHSYSLQETEGKLEVDTYEFATIERPWVPHDYIGGRPFESCIPDGEYQLVPWVRPSGAQVYLLDNPAFGVYAEDADRPDGLGRYLILIHKGNWVTDVVGCIAPGMRRSVMKNPKTGRMERAVSSSGQAMKILRSVLGRDKTHRLIIRPVTGTS